MVVIAHAGRIWQRFSLFSIVVSSWQHARNLFFFWILWDRLNTMQNLALCKSTGVLSLGKINPSRIFKRPGLNKSTPRYHKYIFKSYRELWIMCRKSTVTHQAQVVHQVLMVSFVLHVWGFYNHILHLHWWIRLLHDILLLISLNCDTCQNIHVSFQSCEIVISRTSISVKPFNESQHAFTCYTSK